MIYAKKLMRDYVRDMSTCTAAELVERWDPKAREAVNAIIASTGKNPAQYGFEARLVNHNPIYYLAERVFFSNQPNNHAFLYPPFHRDIICKNVLDHYLAPVQASTGLVLLAPRDTFKSTFMHRVFPTFVSLRMKHLFQRDARVALLHHKEDLASKNLIAVKNIARRHPWFRKNWTEFHSVRDFGTKTQFNWPCASRMFEAESSMTASGLGASLTGGHFDVLIFDDPVTEDHIASQKVRDDAQTRYGATLFTLDSLEGKLFHSGTRYHVNDLWSTMIDTDRQQRYGLAFDEGTVDYHSLVIPAYYEDEATLEREYVYPTRISQEFLERKRAQIIRRDSNDILWWLQYMNSVRGSGMLAASPLWLQYCGIDEINPRTTWRVITVDPAWKGTPNQGEGDFASIQVWAFERRGSTILKYLIDGVHSNYLTDADGKQHIFRLMRRYGVIDVAPEERGSHAFRQALRNEAAALGIPINVIDLTTMQKGKPQRISTFLAEWQTGHNYICRECNPELKRAFVQEFCDYPQVKHDDALDCGAYTSDPAITENYVPNQFGGDGFAAPWLYRRPQVTAAQPRLTRHSGR